MRESWENVRLGTIAKPVARAERPAPGNTYRQIGVRLWGEGAYERESIDGGATKYATLNRVESDDIIVNKIWARNGSVAVIPKGLAGCFGSGEFPTFQSDRGRLEPRWFHWITKTRWFWGACDEKSRGTSGKNRIRPEAFLQIIIPLPPLAEQRRIVAKIDQLAAKIAEARGLRQEAEEGCQALLYAGSTQFFEGKRIAMCRRLEDVTTRITKGESPAWQGFAYQYDGPLFIRSENVLWGRLDAKDANHISREFHGKLSRSQLRASDVLINLVGASIGRACVVPSDLGDANVNQAVGVISPNAGVLDSVYLMRFLLSPPTQDVIHGEKVETARPNISLRDLVGLRVPVPSLEEQRRIVAYLDDLQTKVDRLKALQSQTAAELDALLPAILDKAFKGEL